MKNEKMLERCLELALHLNDEDRALFDRCRSYPEIDIPGLPGLLSDLIRDLEADVASDTCKAAGRNNALSAAKRIFKVAMSTGKSGLCGAWEENGRQCLCDGYRGVRLVNHLPVDHIPEYATPINLSNIVDGVIKNKGVEIELPSIGELKAHIKVEKANKKIRKDRDPVVWDFGEDLMLLDAEYLLDMLEILPGCKAYAASKGAALSPVYFESEAGDGVLLPRRRVSRKTA